MKKRISLITALTVSLFSFSTMSSSGARAKATEPVEILSLRSEYGKHFDNGDGTRTSYVNTAPIHYLEDGEWVEIDNSLVIDENDNYTNVSNPLKVTIPSKLSIGDSSSIGLVSNGNSIQIPLEDIIKNVTDMDIEGVEASVNDVNYTKIEKELPTELLNSFNNSVSSLSYNFDYNCKDLTLEIHPNSLVETLTFDKGATLPVTLSYPIKAADLNIKMSDESNIEFVESDGTVAFTMIAPVIYDSSTDQNCSPITTDIIESDDGCYVTFSLEDAINALNDPVYPLILSTEYTVQRNANTRYNSESSPYENIYNQYIRIGNEVGNGFQTFVSCVDSFTGYSGNVTITDATFNMFLVGNYLNSPKTLKVYSMSTEPMDCSWNNASSLTNYNTRITDFDVAYAEMLKWKDIDITQLVQSWINYRKTSQSVGVASYGFKIITNSNPQATVVAMSERASYNQPYFEINYVVDSDYELTYAPYKYGNIVPSGEYYGNIYNFQKRMNCYAYALQVYYRSYTPYDTYKLKPGEFGIQQNASSQYPVSNYGDLSGYYTSFYDDIMNDTNDNERQSTCKDYMNFIEEQMTKDAAALSYNITPLNTYSSPYYVVDNDFILPSNFNPNNERIIAFVSTLTRVLDTSVHEYNYTFDYHFYLRNGNGTCTNPNHGYNCSKWTHKPGTEEVIDTCANNSSVYLCDDNIGEYANSVENYFYSNNEVRYYRITKNTNIYNSWHGNGHSPTSTGTPYQS